MPAPGAGSRARLWVAERLRTEELNPARITSRHGCVRWPRLCTETRGAPSARRHPLFVGGRLVAPGGGAGGDKDDLRRKARRLDRQGATLFSTLNGARRKLCASCTRRRSRG